MPRCPSRCSTIGEGKEPYMRHPCNHPVYRRRWRGGVAPNVSSLQITDGAIFVRFQVCRLTQSSLSLRLLGCRRQRDPLPSSLPLLAETLAPALASPSQDRLSTLRLPPSSAASVGTRRDADALPLPVTLPTTPAAAANPRGQARSACWQGDEKTRRQMTMPMVSTLYEIEILSRISDSDSRS
uniref:Uncharacterized protein n=1 Tax=Oryza sativa subsp. japonica TaxID=39947 RepID=Q6YWL0_ORYSJ|nr:hypothetical protein [Oryza sativa Japonica Group]BAD10621.1 hypothetical protein [Oryza sativa Japonica Group]